MTTQIVAATDLSERARHAVGRALQLGALTEATVRIVHALGLDEMSRWPAGGQAGWGATLTDEAQALLTAHVEAAGIPGDVQPELRIESARADLAILHAARDAGLLVLGAHGSGFIERVLIGSTTSRVLRKSRIPVLVVKQPPKTAYHRVMVAVDFSPASLGAIATARRIAPAAHLVLAHVVEMPFLGKMQLAGVSAPGVEDYRAETHAAAHVALDALVTQAGLAADRHERMLVEGDPSRALLALEAATACDLIVLGKHGTHVVEELLLGSVTEHLLGESQCDLLVMTDPRRPDPLPPVDS